MTFRQARELGGSVRRGECGTDIVYTRKIATRDERLSAVHEAARPACNPLSAPFYCLFLLSNARGCPACGGPATSG
ncbi:ArdC family protein [Novosphingobium sp. CECT 9465]|uniref:ArdC family protein n=1 Tax=Novosphingobium sp. CECT 9465 TaxID=2829794 RepID=UPI001E3F9C2A|nr:ArdC family protein [Novosphingobium sp. CECT 9465]